MATKRDNYDRCVAGGVREEVAKLTLARKLASVVLRLWKSAAYDCSAHAGALSIVPIGTEGADCNGEDKKTISKEENRP